MSPGLFIILSGTLTFGVPLALALHQLVALRRGGGGGWRPGRRPEPPQPKPLPPCLIPSLPRQHQTLVEGPRPRVLEDA